MTFVLNSSFWIRFHADGKSLSDDTFFGKGAFLISSKEVQIVYRLFLVNYYLLHVPRLPSQPASSGRGWVIDFFRLELPWQYIAMTRNNLSIILISLISRSAVENIHTVPCSQAQIFKRILKLYDGLHFKLCILMRFRWWLYICAMLWSLPQIWPTND